MCWSETASLAMLGLGAAATAVTARRGEPAAIWGTLSYFTAMEGLQAAGYTVVDQCGDPLNRGLTLAAYLHIAFQPLVINVFTMAIAPVPVAAATRRAILTLASVCTLFMLARLVPMNWAGDCRLGEVMCGPDYCLVSGTWHIGWQVPLNGLWHPLGDAVGRSLQFPDYLFAAFILPLVYGAWRFVLFSFLAGPVLAWTLTSDPIEMPAVWCLLSVGIILIGLSPFIRHRVMGAARPALA